METIDIITKLIEVKGATQRDLANYLGINELSITNWKAGRAKSYLKYLPKIAEYFNVSVDYLLGKSDEKNKPGEILDERTIRLNKLMKKLSPDDIDQVLDYVRFLSEKYKDKK